MCVCLSCVPNRLCSQGPEWLAIRASTQHWLQSAPSRRGDGHILASLTGGLHVPRQTRRYKPKESPKQTEVESDVESESASGTGGVSRMTCSWEYSHPSASATCCQSHFSGTEREKECLEGGHVLKGSTGTLSLTSYSHYYVHLYTVCICVCMRVCVR